MYGILRYPPSENTIDPSIIAPHLAISILYRDSCFVLLEPNLAPIYIMLGYSRLYVSNL